MVIDQCFIQHKEHGMKKQTDNQLSTIFFLIKSMDFRVTLRTKIKQRLTYKYRNSKQETKRSYQNSIAPK